MARAQNFAYASPWESVAKSLGTALFGDPEMAGKQRLQNAQLDNYAANAAESRAHAGLFGEQTTGEHTKNAATLSLPDLIAHLLPAAPVAPPRVAMPSDPLAPLPEPDVSQPYYAPPPAPGTFDPHSIAAVIAALAQSQGDKVNMGETINSLGAMIGNDEFARRGLIAGGHTPEASFALTPQRADDIAKQGTDAKYREGTAVAEINNRDDIPVANIQASTARRGQDIGASTARRGQDIGASTARRGQNIRADTAAGGRETGFSLVSDVLPGARMTGGERTPEHNREVDGAEHSYHLPGDGVEAYDVAPGTGAATFEEAKAKLRAKYGARLVEARDETNRPGHGPHWHFAIQSPPKPAKGGARTAAPKGINKASNKLLDDELDAQITAANMRPTPGARTMMKSRAITGFQQTGNPVSAVSDVIADVKRRYEAANSPPAPGARKAPDGKWYVKRGDKYFRVDG